jgi:hypothetical protein
MKLKDFDKNKKLPKKLTINNKLKPLNLPRKKHKKIKNKKRKKID